MRIKYRLKPENERPLQTGMLVRIKRDWYTRLDEIDMDLMDIGNGLGKLEEISNATLFEQGFQLCSFGSLISCNFENIKGTWTIPLDCLEKRQTKIKKITPIQKKVISKTSKTRPITKAKVSPIKIRIKH